MRACLKVLNGCWETKLGSGDLIYLTCSCGVLINNAPMLMSTSGRNEPTWRKKKAKSEQKDRKRITTKPDWNWKRLLCLVVCCYSLHRMEDLKLVVWNIQERLLPSALTHLTASCWLLKRARIRWTLLIPGKAWRWAVSQDLLEQKFTQGFCREWFQSRALLIPLNWFTRALFCGVGVHLLSGGPQRGFYTPVLTYSPWNLDKGSFRLSKQLLQHMGFCQVLRYFDLSK